MVQFLIWFLQFALVGIIMFFITGRLIGTRLNIMKRLFAVGFSVTVTSAAYWYTFVQHRKNFYTPLENESIWFSTFLWIASVLLITMLFHLVLELFEPIQMHTAAREKENIFKRFITRWKLQRRLTNVLRIAFKHGIGRAFGFWRSTEGERSNARSLRLMLEECDGIFIKFGQMLSTRKDLFSETFTTELAKLQQNVKPIPTAVVTERLTKAYGDNWHEKFSDFTMEPIASGSIGQVHRATLFEPHEKVIVKVLRPEITTLLNNDLDLLISFARWLTEESEWAENLGFLDLAQNFANNMREEIDFRLELRNMEQITNGLKAKKSSVKIPKIYPQYSDSTLLVMEYIDGVKITDSAAVLKRNHRTTENILDELFGSFLVQVLSTGVFHGDPHPGNVHIMKETGEVVLLDFGSVGRIGHKEQRGLTLLFLGYHRGDPTIVIDALRSLVENDERLKDVAVEQSVSQLLAELAYLDHLSTGQIVQSLFAIIQQHNMRLFPMVGVALRALITLEGTVSSVSSTYDAFAYANEFTRQDSKLSEPIKKVKNLKSLALEELYMSWPLIKAMPRRLDEITRNLEKGEVRVKMEFTTPDNKSFLTKWLSQFMLLLVAITFGGLSVAMLGIAQFIKNSYIIYLNTAAYVGLFLSLIILVRISIQVIRDSKKYTKK